MLTKMRKIKVLFADSKWNGIRVLASIRFHLLANMLLANAGVCVWFMFYKMFSMLSLSPFAAEDKEEVNFGQYYSC